jgi:L-ascorbate metabolism protein UlaG (beta-lactamase superfamily)
MNAKKFMFGYLLAGFLFSCRGYQQGKTLQEKPFFVKDSFTQNLNPIPTDSIELYYSGCAVFYIKYRNEAVLNDPFMSNKGPLAEVAALKLLTDTTLVDDYFHKIIGSNNDKKGNIKAMLATHTHYDHVLDFPYIYQRKLNKDSVIVLGSSGVKSLLKASVTSFGQQINSKNIISIDSKNASDSTNFRQWIYTKNAHFRFLPILTEHAPHFYGIKLYKGKISDDLKKVPTDAGSYKEGQSLSYLIDILDNKQNIIFRIYVQGSSSSPPFGFPPAKVLAEKQVDVAILCVASFQYVHQHPEGIVNYLKPKMMILSHWENFFQPHKVLEQKVLTVPFTNIDLFLKRLDDDLKKEGLNSKYIMPNINTNINVRF